MLWIRIISLIVLPVALLGCGLDASIENIHEDFSSSITMVEKEIVPASQQGAMSISGYKVQSSVSFNSGSSDLATSAGYKVNMGVQYALFEGEVQ